MDVYATVLGALGLEGGPSRGQSLLTPVPDERLLALSLRRPGTPGRWEALTDGRWHYLRHADGAALYDLDADAGQRDDLADREGERIREFEARRREDDRRLAPFLRGRAMDERLDASEMEDMKSLGYTGEDR